MADYDSLPELREALTSDSPDRRADAYGDVMSEDIQPSQLLETPPDATALQTLRDANVIPDEDRDRGQSMRDVNQRIVELLEQILDELQDDVVVQDEGQL